MDPRHFDEERRRFAERYGSLSPEELLKIAQEPWALSEPAWEALEDEFDRRGLEIPTPSRLESLEKRDLVLLRRFRDLPEALLAKGKLDSAGMETVLADVNTIRMDWLWSNLVGGFKILVSPEEFAEASEILNQPIPETLDFGDGDSYEQPRCPNCGSLDINFEELYQPIAFPSLFIFPLPVLRKGWICHNCDHCWENDDAPLDLKASPSPVPPE